MAKLTEKEREAFEKILAQDLKSINAKFMNQIKDFWAIARKEVERHKGFDKLKEEQKKLEEQSKKIRDRIHEIERQMRAEDLKPEQIVELGGSADRYGHFSNAKFYGIPIESQFDYEIVEFMRKHINIEIPSKILRDICEASMRALTMAGTFEEARAAYEKFYSLNFRKYGVDIPPRLDDVLKDKKMVSFAGKSLDQIENKQEVENAKG